MYISVSCQRFLEFIANDRLCVSLKNFQFVRFLTSWLSQPFFFPRWYIIFCFRIFKVNFYCTSTSIFIWEEIECYSMYIERWISLFRLDKLRMYKSIFSNNVFFLSRNKISLMNKESLFEYFELNKSIKVWRILW